MGDLDVEIGSDEIAKDVPVVRVVDVGLRVRVRGRVRATATVELRTEIEFELVG